MNFARCLVACPLLVYKPLVEPRIVECHDGCLQSLRRNLVKTQYFGNNNRSSLERFVRQNALLRFNGRRLEMLLQSCCSSRAVVVQPPSDMAEGFWLQWIAIFLRGREKEVLLMISSNLCHKKIVVVVALFVSSSTYTSRPTLHTIPNTPHSTTIPRTRRKNPPCAYISWCQWPW